MQDMQLQAAMAPYSKKKPKSVLPEDEKQKSDKDVSTVKTTEMDEILGISRGENGEFKHSDSMDTSPTVS